MFELAWTLLAQREYGEAAPMFLKMTELNSWCVPFVPPPLHYCFLPTFPTFLRIIPFAFIPTNHGSFFWLLGPDHGVYRSHGTYYFIAAGCQWSLGQYDEAQKLLDAITGLLDKKKIGGKDLPTEVLIKKKCALSFLFSFTISTYV